MFEFTYRPIVNRSGRGLYGGIRLRVEHDPEQTEFKIVNCIEAEEENRWWPSAEAGVLKTVDECRPEAPFLDEITISILEILWHPVDTHDYWVETVGGMVVREVIKSFPRKFGDSSPG